MKFSIATSLAFAGLCHQSTTAFAPVAKGLSNNASRQQRMSSSSPIRKMATNDEIEKLRAQAAAAREEATRLAKELGKEDPAAVATKEAPVSTKTSDEIRREIEAIDFSSDPTKQITALDKLRAEGSIKLYKSATPEAGVGDLKSYPVSLSMLEQRSGLTKEALGVGVEEVSLDDFKYATLYVTGGCSIIGVAALAFLPENIGATICYLVALIPILFLGVGSTAPAAIANAIAAVKGQKDDVDRKTRVCRHEAAHMLCGYMCGLPIADYIITEENIPRVEFYNTAVGPATAQQEFTQDEVNALTVVAMSGSVAEAMEFGKAGGVNNDLMELDGVFRKSKEFLGAEKQQDLTRWGALTAYRLLTANKDKLNALVAAFDARKSVAECVAILEQ